MPLPNCGYFNKEEKKSQELIFKGPPQIVEETDSDEGIGGSRSSSSGKSVRAKVTTGKLEIELERKMVIHNDRDPEIWKKPDIDQTEIERARKVSSPTHQKMRSEVRSTIGTFISGNKVNQLRSDEEKKASFAELDHVASSILKKEGHLEPPAREETITAVRIQPTGIYCCGGKHNSRNHPGGVKFSFGGSISPSNSVSGSTSPNPISVMTATKQITQSVSSRRVSGSSSYSTSSTSTN